MSVPNVLPAKTLRRLITLWLLLLQWPYAAAAAGTWDRVATPVFRHANPPGDIIPMALLQDREGAMWLASQTGLIRWDGYRFQRYGDAATLGGLFSTYINALHEDDPGHLWVGTDADGLLRVDKAGRRFWQLGEGPQGLSSVRVFALASDRTGSLWIGGAAGLDRFDPATGKVQRAAERATPPGLPSARVSALLVDRSGNLWVGTAKGLYVLHPGAHAFRPMPVTSGKGEPVNVQRLAEDGEGRVWVGTGASGAFVIEPGATTARHVRDSERGDGKGVETELITAIADAGNGQVWLGTWGQGVVQVDTRSWRTRRLRHHPDVPASLAGDVVRGMLRDRSGLVWVLGDDLLDSHDPAQRAVSTWYGTQGRLLGGARGYIDAVLAQPDGSVWLGNTGNGGVDIIRPDGTHGLRLAPDDSRPRTALPKTQVTALAKAPDGTYIGTSRGLYLASENGRRVGRMEPKGLATDAKVTALCAAGGELWMGGISGLRHFDRLAEGAEVREVPGLAREEITTLVCPPNGPLWVGTATGLLRYRPATGQLERPWPEEPGRIGMPSTYVTSVVEDGRGRLWVAFYGGGVRVVEPGIDGAVQIHRIGHEEGVPNNAANALLLDAEGHAWVSTDNGIVRIDRDTLAPALLQQADGVGVLTYRTMSAAATPDGDLVFGGRGLSIVHPAAFRPWKLQAPILLTADDLPVPASGLTLEPSRNALQVNFALLDYSAPERARYAYRLVGLEEAWTGSAELRAARYTNLPPGDYVLEVKAANRSGEWTTGRWPLHVEPAWYETMVFRAALAVLALGLVGALVHLRTHLLQRRAVVLKDLVAQRTHELEQRTDELETSRKALSELGAHNVQALEEERKRVARELHDELGQQLAALRMEVSVMRIRTGSGQAPTPEQWEQMHGRVDQLVASMRGLVSELRPPALDGGLAAALEWLAGEFSRVTGVPCEVKVEGDPGARSLGPDVATMVFRIAQESLNNVRRHAQAQHAYIALRQDGGDWWLTVSDDGVGFDVASASNGYGLLGMEERARLLGGPLQIDSAPGRGTRVHLRVQVAED